MADKDYIDPNHERLQDAKAQGESNLEDYETSMNAAISSNNQAKNDALNEIGKMESNGKWTPGSATANLADAMNKQTDFAIEEIKQQKEQAKKDYTKEQSGAYVDWQKQSNAYGANAEARASSGLQNSGYAESSQVSMYNQYQARITAARESYVQIVQDYNNSMTQARLQNNSALAQIYADAMAKRLEITTQFAFKNTELLTTLAQQKAALKQQNFSNYMSVYNQLSQEKQHSETLAEQKRQFDEQMKFEKQKYEDTVISSGGGGGGGGSGSGSSTKKTVASSDVDKITGKLSNNKQEKATEALANATFRNQEDAIKFMAKYGITAPEGYTMIKQGAWDKQKSMGTPGWEFDGYNSYADYLRAYVTVAIQQMK